jgi:hypothetical protein
MPKLGVGVGEEFPLDEENGPQPEQETGPNPDCEEWRRRRAMHREAWRRFRNQMRAEWSQRRRAFREGLRRQDDVEPMDTMHDRHLHHLVIGGLALIGLAALLGLHRR